MRGERHRDFSLDNAAGKHYITSVQANLPFATISMPVAFCTTGDFARSFLQLKARFLHHRVFINHSIIIRYSRLWCRCTRVVESIHHKSHPHRAHTQSRRLEALNPPGILLGRPRNYLLSGTAKHTSLTFRRRNGRTLRTSRGKAKTKRERCDVRSNLSTLIIHPQT
jgi:hypothetical protein